MHVEENKKKCLVRNTDQRLMAGEEHNKRAIHDDIDD